ncbi:hypothetical protein HRbin41_01410 [bacterium HR41]|nr:hypothetical protein HRbin41_01410 [bacterium HR41]
MVAEAHRDDRLAGAGIELLAGVTDVAARKLDVVFDHEVALDLFGLVRCALGLDDEDPLRNPHDDAARRWAACAQRAQLARALRALRVALGGAGPRLVVRQQLVATRVGPLNEPAIGTEQVVASLGAVVAPVVVLEDLAAVAAETSTHGGRDAFGRHIGRLGAWLLSRRYAYRLPQGAAAGVRLVRPAAAQHVRLPVVKLELSGGSDLLDRPLGVLDVGQPDGNLIGTGALDFGLGDTERVGALADRLDRIVDRLRGDLGHLRGRLTLVDQLDAAAQVETEARRFVQRRAGHDHQRRQHEQRGDEREDRAVAPSGGHEVSTVGVRISRAPPSSS